MAPEDDKWEELKDQTVINVNFTLDVMGGTRSSEDIERIQNYVDPQKFRVLFFDSDDKFLFESKSRWVRVKNNGTDHISWQVSVPFFTYGNDYEYEWDWDQIKDKLTSEDFKIALLVNRPENDWYPGFSNTGEDPSEAERWFDNSGPHWKRINSIGYQKLLDDLEAAGHKDQADDIRSKVGEPKVMDIFDIHHSQGDPIYNGKNYYASGSNGHFYDIVLGEYMDGKPSMSSTASWVDWTVKYNPPGRTDWNIRPTRMPDEKYPIPMYGVQSFQSIDPQEWLPGTTFSLDREGIDKPISLLRSVVRLDLYIPARYEVQWCGLYYANVYSRCEPMNNWTPTDQLWNEAAHYVTGQPNYNGTQGQFPHITTCDEDKLVAYGPITANGWPQTMYYYDTQTGRRIPPTLPTQDLASASEANKQAYWEKLAYLYGAWLEKGWSFGDLGYTRAKQIVDQVKAQKGIDPPQIMNSCIQRNERIWVDPAQDFKESNGDHHYIVYIGERNVNDPSKLQTISSTSSGDPTIMHWTFGLIDTRTGETARYSVAVADYEGRYGTCYERAAWKVYGSPGTTSAERRNFPYNEYYGEGNTYPNLFNNTMGIPSVNYNDELDVPTNLGTKHTYSCYINGLTGLNWQSGSGGSGFMAAFQRGDTKSSLPLIRNHIYTLRLVDANTRAEDGGMNFTIQSEVKRSPTIGFQLNGGSQNAQTLPANGYVKK